MTHFVALASDYDGTLAEHGTVSGQTIEALEAFRRAGRQLILVSGRELKDLESVFSRFNLFDRIVAENGGVLYCPATREKKLLTSGPKQELVTELERRGITNISVGETIISTWHPNETGVLKAIRDLGLELHVVFNKGAVMVLPSGVNKKSGLAAALESLDLSEHNVIGVGDAENDHAFLEYCECSAAVANALDAVKTTADLTTQAGHGAGVAELIHRILNREVNCPARRAIPIGWEGSREVSVPSCGTSLLIGGASGSGKSTFVTGLLETLIERRYQFCLIDPEGDYEHFPGTVGIGDEKHPPSPDQIMHSLQRPATDVVVNLMGISVEDRPRFLDELLPRLLDLRARNGRPHWIIIDEAHHMFPSEWTIPSAEAEIGLENLVLVTVHPDKISPAALRGVETVLAKGPDPGQVMDAFAKTVGIGEPHPANTQLGSGEILAWFPRTGSIQRLRMRLSQPERRRHRRNYSAGELGADKSFYFRGPEGKLNLMAQNLTMFLQLAKGVDDDTWNYHLQRGDYSHWFREVIKDDELADEVAQWERPDTLSPRESRDRVRAAVEHRYTAPV